MYQGGRSTVDSGGAGGGAKAKLVGVLILLSGLYGLWTLLMSTPENPGMLIVSAGLVLGNLAGGIGIIMDKFAAYVMVAVILVFNIILSLLGLALIRLLIDITLVGIIHRVIRP